MKKFRKAGNNSKWSVLFALGIAATGLSATVSSAQASLVDTLKCGFEDLHYRVVLNPLEPNVADVEGPLSDGSANHQPSRWKMFKVGEDGLRSVIYQGNGWRFEQVGNTYDLIEGDAVFACTFLVAEGGEDEQPPFDPAEGNNAPYAQSLGGKLRSGPGMNYKDIGSLNEGYKLRLVRNTGVRMNGYDWFELELLELGAGHGPVFQWGGIMCSENYHVPGVYRVCAQQKPTPVTNQPADVSASFMAINNTGSAATLQYLPDNGRAETTATVQPYSSVLISSYLGHRFWFTKGDAIYGEFTVQTKKGGVFQINE